jgi:arsenate reductase
MAEGFASRIAPPGVRVYSAGTAPVGVNPRAVAAMAEVGVDLSGQRSVDVSEIPAGELDLVVTLCGDAEDFCPAFSEDVRREHWPLADPARAEGDEEEIQRVFREVRDEIRERVRALFAAEETRPAC